MAEVNYKNMEITKDYYGILHESIKDAKEYEMLLKYLPEFYRILCNIISNKKTGWYTRILVDCALSYLVLEKDVLPDKKSKKGYLDDLFLFSYILKEIRDKISKNIILDNLYGVNLEVKDEKIFDLIYDVYSRCCDILEGKEEEVLEMVGISKFSALDLLCANDRAAQLTRGKKKLKLLYAMAAVIIKEKMIHGELDTSGFGRSISSKRFKEYIINHPEYGEIKRYGAFLSND